MHPDFPKWLRSAYVEATDEQISEAWARVDAAVKAASADTTLEFVRAAYGLPSTATSLLSSDSNKEGAEHEDRILSCAVLVQLFASAGSRAVDIAALASLSRATIASSVPTVETLTDHARTYLMRRSIEVRRRTEIPRPKVAKATMAKKLEALGQAIEAGQTLKEPLVGYLEANYQDFLGLASTTAAALQSIDRLLGVQAEESNIFWWVYSRRSQTIDRAFDDSLDFGFKCLLSARELADLTETIPGPRSAPAFLQTMLNTGKRRSKTAVQLQAAVNSAPRDWRENLARDYELRQYGDLTPTLAAIHASLLTEEPEAWTAVHAKSSKADAKVEIEGHVLASEFYNELLLSKALG